MDRGLTSWTRERFLSSVSQTLVLATTHVNKLCYNISLYINRFCRSSLLSADVKSTESSLSVSFGGNLEAVINLDFQFRGEVRPLPHNSAPSIFTLILTQPPKDYFGAFSSKTLGVKSSLGGGKSLQKMSSYPEGHCRHQPQYFRKCWNWGKILKSDREYEKFIKQFVERRAWLHKISVMNRRTGCCWWSSTRRWTWWERLNCLTRWVNYSLLDNQDIAQAIV